MQAVKYAKYCTSAIVSHAYTHRHIYSSYIGIKALYVALSLSLSLLSCVLYIAIDNSAHSAATTANLCAYTHIGMHQFFACLARHCSLWLSEKSYHCIPKCFFINSRAKYCDDDVEMLLHGRKNEGNKKKERKKKKMK